MKRPILEDALHVLLILGLCLFFLSGCGVVPEGSSETAFRAFFEEFDGSDVYKECLESCPQLQNLLKTLAKAKEI